MNWNDARGALAASAIFTRTTSRSMQYFSWWPLPSTCPYPVEKLIGTYEQKTEITLYGAI